MAAIDKIYGTRAEYKELKAWIRKNAPEYLTRIYTWPKSQEIGPISNFTKAQDSWLYINCPIEWVCTRIKIQHNEFLDLQH